MLSPSLRLLVRHQARPVSLQLQCYHASTDTRQNGFTSFTGWVRELHEARRRKQSNSGSEGAQGGGPLKKKKKKTTKPKAPHSTRKNPSNAMTREQRILKTVLNTVPKKRKPQLTTKSTSKWPAENWSPDGWGLDSRSRILNLGTIERTDHNEPGQSSNLHPQIEVLSLRLRNLRFWS